MDVFVFDALFLNYFRYMGWLEALQIEEIDQVDDFLEYAINGIKFEELYYGVQDSFKAHLVYRGTREIQKNIIAKVLLGRFYFF